MKCAKCGAQLKDGCIYCSMCGHEAQIVPDSVLEDDYLKALLGEDTSGKKNTSKVVEKRKASPQPSKKSVKKKKNYLIPILVVTLAVIVIVTLIIYMVINKQQNNSFDYQYSQGIQAIDEKDYDSALTYFNRALELDKENTEVMMALAEIYQEQDDYRMEESVLLQILKLDDDNETAYGMLIALYDEQSQYTKIIELRDKLQDASFYEELFSDYEVKAPEFSMEDGIYSEESEVEILAEPGYTIYYSLGNTDPISEGQKYTSAIPINEGETIIRAVAKDERGLYSEVIYAKYVVEFLAPDAPSVTPYSGSYSTPQMITVKVPEDSVVYYTWDGTTPDEGSNRYDGAIEMPVGNNVLSLIAINKRGLSSRVAKYNYIYLPDEA